MQPARAELADGETFEAYPVNYQTVGWQPPCGLKVTALRAIYQPKERSLR